MKKSLFYLLLTIAIAIISGIWAYNFMQSESFRMFVQWAQQHLLIYIAVLIFFKFLSVLYPPLPSSILTLSAIPVLGWFYAYLIDYTGSILGSSISYFIARKYGKRVLEKIFDNKTVEVLSRFKVKKGREIESVIVLRVLIGGTLIEAVNYGAGLLRVPYRKFLIGFLISHPLLGIPTFYLVKNIFDRTNLIFTLFAFLMGVVLLYLLRNRYFEKVTK